LEKVVALLVKSVLFVKNPSPSGSDFVSLIGSEPVLMIAASTRTLRRIRMAKRIITTLITADEQFVLGEETNRGRVEGISFRGDRHKTTGASYVNCYVVTFLGSTLEVVIPLHSVKHLTTDLTDGDNDEDVGHTPELPD